MPQLVSRNFNVNGKRTTIKLEPQLWNAYDVVKKKRGLSDDEILVKFSKPDGTRTSELRTFIVDNLRAMINSQSSQRG